MTPTTSGTASSLAGRGATGSRHAAGSLDRSPIHPTTHQENRP